MKTILIAQIALELSPCVRAAVNDEAVSEYADLYRAGKDLPEPVVFKDENGELRLADGRHRLDAAMAAGLDTIKCEVREGGYSEALQYACASNVEHGLRRTNADKRACVAAALKEWPRQSDRQIGELCSVDHKTVAAVRVELSPKPRGEIPTQINVPVGTKPAKPMGARAIPGAPIEHVIPPPPPEPAKHVAAAPHLIDRVQCLVRDFLRLPHRDPAFQRCMSNLLNFQKYIQGDLPGFGEHFALNPSVKPQSVTAADIYEAYPKKVGRPVALAAIEKQMKITPPEKLLERTKLFAQVRGGDLEFVAHPSTWFNQQRYNDNPDTWKPKAPLGRNGKPVVDVEQAELRRLDRDLERLRKGHL